MKRLLGVVLLLLCGFMQASYSGSFVRGADNPSAKRDLSDLMRRLEKVTFSQHYFFQASDTKRERALQEIDQGATAQQAAKAVDINMSDSTAIRIAEEKRLRNDRGET